MKDRIILLAAVLGVGPFLSTALSTNAAEVTKPRPGVAGEWKLIGRTHASHSADHDTIVVQGPFDNFRRVKFKVTDAPLDLQRMVITYGNGERDKIDVRENIPKGGESRVIDLHGEGQRSIRKIEFWYDTKGSGQGTADVTVFGMK